MNKTTTINTVYMPAVGGGTEPAPFLLTKEEAARFLRIDGEDSENTLRRYHGMGLKPTRVGMSNKYALDDLITFIRNKRGE